MKKKKKIVPRRSSISLPYSPHLLVQEKRRPPRSALNIGPAPLPPQTPEGQSTYRSITVDGEEVEFSGGFTDLHTASYRGVLDGEGFGLTAVRPSIEAVSAIRTAPLEPGRGEAHPMLAAIRAA